MLSIKSIIKSVFAVAGFVTSFGAMAASATLAINKPLLTSNGITVSALGNAVINSAGDQISMVINAASSQLPTLADFDNNDGFVAQAGSGFTAYSLSFSNLQFNNQGTLTGALQGTGALSNFSFQGEQLVAESLSDTPAGLLATSFTLSPSLQNYLTSNNAPSSVLTILDSFILSSTTPGLVTAAIPEPSSYALMSLGMLCTLLVVRKRRLGNTNFGT